MLTALERLTFGCFGSTSYCDMSRNRLALRLPHLTVLKLHWVAHGEITVSCTKLEDAQFFDTKSLEITIIEWRSQG